MGARLCAPTQPLTIQNSKFKIQNSKTPMPPSVTLIDHPLIQHKLTIMRKKGTSTAKFRQLLGEISMLLAYEVTRDMPLEKLEIETPLAKMDAPMLAGKKVVLISIMRAGQGILDGMLQLMPSARVGHIGLYRDPRTHIPVEYYFKVPSDVHEREMLVVDPMLATGNSAVAAVYRLKETSPQAIKFVCLLAAPEGIAHFHEEHPDVPIYTAAIDEKLAEHGYILPGLGDAGDRMFGTR
jgi:uracil phosphoribosyltransferase